MKPKYYWFYYTPGLPALLGECCWLVTTGTPRAGAKAA